MWRHFQNGHQGNWQNHVFSYNSALRVDRNEISVSTPIFLRVRNSIKALTSFYDFYLTHDELPVWHYFRNDHQEIWRNHVFAYNSASRMDRNEISASTPIFLRVGNSIKALTSFYDFWLMMNYLCDAIFKMTALEIGVFSYNSASKVNMEWDFSVYTHIFRVRNSIQAFTRFYDFYLTHDELPVWHHFQNGHHENWQNHILG